MKRQILMITFILALVLSFQVSGMVSAEETTKVKVGYLHTVAVDGNLWVGVESGIYEKHGIEVDAIQFNSGIPLMQALSGGSVDVAVMGAVISNFPSRGVGKIFLLNNIEYNTAMIFVQDDSGIESVADLKGREVATTQGTTAHVFLVAALKSVGIDPSEVEVINMDMAAAVSAFISGAVPAVATWLPFDIQIKRQNPSARVLTTAADYYPESAIMGGWVASDNYYDNHKEVLQRIAEAWLETNYYMITNTEEALKLLHETHYSEIPLSEVQYAWEQQLNMTNNEWAEMYQSSQAAEWIGQVERIFIEIGAFTDYVDPSEFFDSEIFLKAYEAWKASQQ